MSSLKKHFRGAACKYLSAVDAHGASNQHEIGSNKFATLLGDPGSERRHFQTTFLNFEDDDDAPITATDMVTWYDTRLNQPKRSAEYRLYYKDNAVTATFEAGDFCLLAVRTNGELLLITAPPQSAHERRLRQLFDLPEIAASSWIVQNHIAAQELGWAASQVLDALGIDTYPSDPNGLDRLVSQFDGAFPSTGVFSKLARDTLSQSWDVSADPDGALQAWMQHEEALFRALERVQVGQRIKTGFTDVDDFVSYSLSVQNRRKSRAGHALENHLEAVFKATKVTHVRGAKTEGQAKPDFLFPDLKSYRDPQVGSPPLQMLAAKSSCKDRWRQILAEAARIPIKHLLTLETALSENQTDEMRHHGVQLVVPPFVSQTYSARQQLQVITLKAFIQQRLSLQ